MIIGVVLVVNKKNDILGIVENDGSIKLATNDDRSIMQSLVGRVVAIKPKRKGVSLSQQRRFFALINLGFTYQPSGIELVSEPEKWLARAIAKELGSDQKVVTRFIDHLSACRTEKLDDSKFDAKDVYRKSILIKAGFYDLVPTPCGGVIQQARSISLESVKPSEFQNIYSQCFRVIWKESLSCHFDDEQSAENAINQLMSLV